MTLQNRVTPFGDLVALPARGLLFGNRGGRFHDPGTRTLRRRRWASRRWLVCVLDFKGRHRDTVWGRGYTELFFLDEPTALAAGHRPCAECRRAGARAFQAACGHTGRLEDLDLRLHAERLGPRETRRLGALPEGAMVAEDGQAFAWRGGGLLPWSAQGYGTPIPAEPGRAVRVLTPPLTLAALASGYAPLWHPSADPT